VKRREFIAGVGSAAAWPVVAQAQQPAIPVIGWLSPSHDDDYYRIATIAFLQGLKETGYVEGQNVAIQYRWAENQYDRQPALAADLVRRRTGIASFGGELAPKRLQLLRELIPNAALFGVLADPVFPNTPSLIADVQAAARTLGRQLIVVNAGNDSDLEAAFAAFSQQHVGAALIGDSSFYARRMEQLAALAASHALPAIFPYREYVLAGGLMSYGSSFGYGFHQVGIYTGRILKGEKPADLPFEQATRIELIVNLKTAKTLGLTIPETLLATADEVIQ
jgi:putative ABC transport system substrate-binding protein